MKYIPLVSVVTSVLNGKDTLEKAIDSVRTQDYKHIEYIVIDGGSCDGSVDIIKRRQNDIDFWSSEPDHGVYDAWNKALSQVRGEWVIFLGADDTLLPGSITVLVDALNSSSSGSIDLVSGRVRLGRAVFGAPWDWDTFRRRCCIAHCGAMHNIKLFEKYGTFDSSFKIAGDYEFLLRIGPQLKAVFVDSVLVEMGENGLSSLNSLVFREASRAKRLNNTASLCVCIFDHAIGYCRWVAGRLRKLFSPRLYLL